MLVRPGNSKIRSRPTRIYLRRNSPKSSESKYPPCRPNETKKPGQPSSLMRFKFSIMAVVLIIIFHCLYRSKGNSSQKDVIKLSSKSSRPVIRVYSSNASDIPNITDDATIEKGKQVQKDDWRKVNWKRPLVDRAMLEQVDGNPRVRRERQEDTEIDSFRKATWRPTVWEIPRNGRQHSAETQISLQENSNNEPVSNINQLPSPSPAVYSPPQRFLLPFRIAEQESRARMHLSQLIQLAKELNRTFVLPNVGKSRIGACYHWGFETYYDIESLVGHDVAKPEDFKTWAALHPSARSLTLSVRSQTSQDSRQNAETIHEDVYFKAYLRGDTQEPRQLPACLMKRFPLLQATHQAGQVVVNEDTDARMLEKRGASFLSVLKSVATALVEREDTVDVGRTGPLAAEPEVLIVDWDLRHPIFENTPALQYSAKLFELAKRVAPKHPYIAVHWRTETVAPYVLGECAYALIDAMDAVLHNESKAKDITTVWLASDYPRAVNEKEDGLGSKQFGKSGTYKRLTAELEGAIEILRESFSESGPLYGWRIRDLFDVQRDVVESNASLLDDSGSRGILDKLISANAKVFLSGSRSCSRHSSYTAQIIQARQARGEWEGNLAGIFGW